MKHANVTEMSSLQKVEATFTSVPVVKNAMYTRSMKYFARIAVQL